MLEQMAFYATIAVVAIPTAFLLWIGWHVALIVREHRRSLRND